MWTRHILTNVLVVSLENMLLANSFAQKLSISFMSLIMNIMLCWNNSLMPLNAYCVQVNMRHS